MHAQSLWRSRTGTRISRSPHRPRPLGESDASPPVTVSAAVVRTAVRAVLLRQISEQRQHVSHGGPDTVHRYTFVEPVRESIAVFYEKRAHSVAGDVLIAKPHAVARAGRHRWEHRHPWIAEVDRSRDRVNDIRTDGRGVGCNAALGYVLELNRGVRCDALQFLHDLDRKSTRLNSSHSQISYAVFCLKKKK